MTVAQMIEALQKMPQDAEIFEGVFYSSFRTKEITGQSDIPLVELYDRQPTYFAKVWSCGSSAPWKREIKEHVVILEAE